MSNLRMVVVALAVAAAFAATAVAQPETAPSSGLIDNGGGSCGVKLVLRNPDLQERSDGFIYASGWFFIQFQAVGAGAENVKSFTFSFGKPLPDGAANCSTPAGPVTGAYLLNYRGDYTPDDGFFVPINTTLVRDDEYGAAVHAYDQPNAQGREIGRFYVKAKVQNGCQQMQCRDKTVADIQKQDKVMPWPRILPGDGVPNAAAEGLSIEFAEGIQSVQAFVNGNETPLEPFEGTPMDDDIIPGNDNEPCTSTTPGCLKRVWGPAYRWKGLIAQNDVVRVVATDLNGNRVEKILHLLDLSQGAIVSGEQVDLSVEVANSTVKTSPQTDAEFFFTFISVSSTDAHVNLGLVDVPEKQMEARWMPDHVIVKPGERAKATILVRGKDGVTSGTFDFVARPSWRSAGQDVVKEFPLTFVVGSGLNAAGASPEANATEAAAKAADGKTPGLSIVVVGSVVAAAAWTWRRRTP